MFHDFCQSVTLVFCQRTHVSHDHHPRGPCCSRARISYDEPYMGAISYQKIFASALRCSQQRCTATFLLRFLMHLLLSPYMSRETGTGAFLIAAKARIS